MNYLSARTSSQGKTLLIFPVPANPVSNSQHQNGSIFTFPVTPVQCFEKVTDAACYYLRWLRYHSAVSSRDGDSFLSAPPTCAHFMEFLWIFPIKYHDINSSIASLSQTSSCPHLSAIVKFLPSSPEQTNPIAPFGALFLNQVHKLHPVYQFS